MAAPRHRRWKPESVNLPGGGFCAGGGEEIWGQFEEQSVRQRAVMQWPRLTADQPTGEADSRLRSKEEYDMLGVVEEESCLLFSGISHLNMYKLNS